MAQGQRYVQQDEITHVREHVSRALGDYPHTTAAREFLDNAADEVARGHATKVDIIYHDDNSIEIRDNGRGLDVSFYDDRDKNGIVASIGSSRAGENFAQTGITAGVHGEGAAAGNYISDRLDVTVFNNGKKYTQQFKEGRPGHFEGNTFDPAANFTQKDAEHLKPQKITESDAPEHGTWIRFHFDPKIAAHDELDKEELNKRARMVTWLTPGMTTTITENGETETINPEKRGTVGVLKEAADLDAVATFDGEFEFDIKDRRGNVLHTKKVEYEVSIAPAAEPQPISTVNSVYTLEGGQHQDATQRALGAGAASKTLRNLNRKTGEAYPDASDFESTIMFAVAVKYPGPSFSGQDKRKLSESQIFANRMVKELERKVTAWAQSPANTKALLQWAKVALEHARAQQKIVAAKQSVKLHTGYAPAGSNLSLPDKYLPCEVTGPDSGAELIIGEGDSAIGTVKAGRYSLFQAAYPLRGKIPNAYKTSLTTMKKKEIFNDIAALMNTGIGAACDTSKRRFDRVLFVCDADVDGYNINSLLIALFIQYYLSYVEEGRVFIAIPPLFIVTSNNPNDRIMCINEKERDEAIQRLEKAGRTKIEVQRCKGLGEMNAVDFRRSVLNPNERVLLQVEYAPEIDDEDLNVVFAAEANQRREWMRQVGETENIDKDDIMA